MLIGLVAPTLTALVQRLSIELSPVPLLRLHGRQLLGGLHSPIRRATLIYCDNVSVVYLSMNLV
jgi:hypothetical protein